MWSGPQTYNTNHIKFLKRSPSATVGRSKRLFINTTTIAPGPNKYSGHLRMTDGRINSKERNAPSATIGNQPKSTRERSTTPGPQNYINIKKTIGDSSSTSVPFTTQIRPVSAKNGQIKTNIQPGPQDYVPVDTDVYRRRVTVIPKFRFNQYDQDKH